MARKVPLLDRAVEAFPEKGRDELYAAVVCGEMFVDGGRVQDPKRLVGASERLELRPKPFVSRGGLKLDFALDRWGIEAAGRVFIDAGASTGGFTDCLLRRGAAFVHAVDVGRNQLAFALRRDPRVGVREGTNVLALSPADLDPRPDAAVADLSFRSIRGAARHLLALAREGWLIALLKPQFELPTPERSRFDGVVRDPLLREATVEAAIEALEREGASVERRLQSPIPGRKGNIEYLLFIRRRSA